MDRVATEAELRALRRRGEEELARLQAEHECVKRLIAFIDEYTGAKPPKTRKRPRKQRAGKPSLLEVIGERPGVRTTMLAMVTGREVDEVAERLARHKEGGEIERDGLGWRLRH